MNTKTNFSVRSGIIENISVHPRACEIKGSNSCLLTAPTSCARSYTYKLTESFVTKIYQLKSCNIKNPEAWFMFQLMCTVVIYNAWKFHDDSCLIFRVMAISLTQKVHFFSPFWCCTWKMGNFYSLIIFLSWPKTYYWTASINFILTFTSSKKTASKLHQYFGFYVVTKSDNFFYKNDKECIAVLSILITGSYILTI